MKSGGRRDCSFASRCNESKTCGGLGAACRSGTLAGSMKRSRTASVRNVLTCREASVPYREDVALEEAWHGEIWTVGLNHTMVTRLAQWYLR